MPLGVQQRRVDMAPVAGVVDQQHRRDREAAEGIEGEDAILHSTFFPKPSGTLISAAITKLGTVATSTQAKKGT